MNCAGTVKTAELDFYIPRLEDDGQGQLIIRKLKVRENTSGDVRLQLKYDIEESRFVDTLTKEQKAENESVWNCPKRSVASMYLMEHSITGELFEEYGTSNECGPWTTPSIKKDYCEQCGKTFHYS